MQKFPLRMFSRSFTAEDLRKPWRTRERAELSSRGVWLSEAASFYSPPRREASLWRGATSHRLLVPLKKRQSRGWNCFCSSLSPASPYIAERVSGQFYGYYKMTLWVLCRSRLPVDVSSTGCKRAQVKSFHTLTAEVLSRDILTVTEQGGGLRSIRGLWLTSKMRCFTGIWLSVSSQWDYHK